MNTSKKIEIMEAYKSKKIVQYVLEGRDDWSDLLAHREPVWDWSRTNYRIKPISDDHWNSNIVPLPPFTVRNKKTGSYSTIAAIGNKSVKMITLTCTSSGLICTYEELFDKYVYIPDQLDRDIELPCGIQNTEDDEFHFNNVITFGKPEAYGSTIEVRFEDGHEVQGTYDDFNWLPDATYKITHWRYI